jgi:hypothetical protein
MRRFMAVAFLLAAVWPGAARPGDPPPPVAGQTYGQARSVLIRPGKTDGMANDFRVHLTIGDGGTLIYAPGVFTQSIHIGADSGFTSAVVKAQTVTWPPNVVLDGGATDLAWGKSMFLVSGGVANTAATFPTTGTIDGFLIRNVGDKQADSGGAGGAYADGGAMLIVRDSDFENNANGISAQDKAVLVDVRDSAFSLTQGNGATDGRSHDAYVAAARNLFTRIIVGGLGTGNDIKIRAPYGRIDQSFLVAANGRWLDAPWGGDMAVSNSVLVQMPGADSGNMFAYAEEGSDHIDPAVPASGLIRYINDLIVVTRHDTVIMIDDGQMDFSGCRWLFVQTDPLPPSLKIVSVRGRPGKVTGLPYPVGSDGVMRTPRSAILGDRSAIPPTPGDPHLLPALLARLLPGPIVPPP